MSDTLFTCISRQIHAISSDALTQFARLATHLEKLKPLLKPVLAKFVTEEEFLAMPSAERNLFEMVKLQVSD